MHKKESFFYYLNPGNVSAAIARYGYTYRVKNTILIYLAVTVLSVLCGFVFRLDLAKVCVVAVCGMSMVPRAIINGYRNMYEQKRFSDVNLYMEQVLYSFKKMPKIITSLQDVEKIMPKDSPMRKTVQEAIRYILYEYSEENSIEAGLKIIEQNYKCQRLKDVHALMVKTEKIGGDYESSVKILLSSRAIWETETCKFQKECKNRQRMVNIALVLVCGVCLFTPLIITKFAPIVDITSSQVYKIGTVIMILISMRTYIKADTLASVNWLRSECAMTEEELLALYQKVTQYDYRCERRKSLLWALIPAGFLVLFGLVGWKWPALICIPVFFVMLNQHKLGYRLAKKRCAQEITKAFPQWLMEISLLLQVSENVNAAIAKSLEGAPVILAEALQKMQEQIMENPESNEPYMNFMKEFQMIEVQSAMGMLYSISSGRGGDADLQIDEILSKNASLLSQSENAANDGRLAALYWQFLFPSIIGGGKLVADMTLVTIAFMTTSLY
ncbi:MAG: hypothetical protein HFJ05_07280 [Eubacterium sp.]|nr:hypothetical protein [Eubacterium sp.]